jgi:hypothetical protein
MTKNATKQEANAQSARRVIGMIAHAADELGVAKNTTVTVYVRKAGRVTGWAHGPESFDNAIRAVKAETTWAIKDGIVVEFSVLPHLPTINCPTA